jgi:hypothetical protein
MNKIQLALLDLINSTVENIKKHDVGEILNWILRNQIADAGIKSPRRTERIVKRYNNNFTLANYLTFFF